jgi:hypothetical protein
MKAPKGARDDVKAILSQIEAEARAGAGALDRLAEAAQALQTSIEQGVESAFNPPSTAPAWRAAHRSGAPARIDSDPELQAFIRARIADHTFDRIIAAIDAEFPPERRTSRSSLSRWWTRNRPPINTPSTS